MLFIIFFQFLAVNTQYNIEISDYGYQENDVFQHERNRTYYSQNQPINCSYFYIQIDLQSFNENNTQTEVALLTKKTIAPYFDINQQIQFDHLDINGHLLNKNYHHLLLETISDTYITILTNQPLKYNLTITSSNIQICPKNCFKNGICVNAFCSCYPGFIGEDCSQQAQEICMDTQVTIINPEFLYVNQLNQSTLWKLTITTTNPFGIMIYFLYRIQKISKPTPKIYDNYVQINQQKQVILEVDTTKYNKLILLIQQIENKQDFEITITMSKYKIEQTYSLVPFIMIGVGIFFFIIVVIFLIRYLIKRQRGIRQYEIRLQSIKIIKIYEIPEDANDECSICLCKFDSQSPIRMTICNHFFHSCCLLKWLEYNNKCPICRKEGIF